MENNYSENSSQLNIAKLFKVCLKNWKYFVIGVLGCCMLAGAYLLIRKPYVEVDAQLMLPPEGGSGGILSLADMASTFSMGDMFGGSSTENEIAVMKSHSVFENTAKQLGLNVSYYQKEGFLKWMPAYDQARINVTTPIGISDTLRTGLFFKLSENSNGNFDISLKVRKKTILKEKNVPFPATVSTPYGTFIFSKTKYYDMGDPVRKFKVKISSYSAAAEGYAEVVNVFTPNKKTDLIGLSYITTDAKFGKLLLNSVIDNYNLLYNQQKDDNNNRTLNFVDNRLNTLAGELAVSEGNMERFKKENNLTDVTVDASTTLEKSSKYEGQLMLAQMEQEIIGLTRDFISNPDNKYSLIPNLSTSLGGSEMAGSVAPAASEIASYNDLIIRRMQLLASAKPNNTALKTLDEQIDALRDNIIVSIEQIYQNSKIRVKELNQKNEEMKLRMGSIPTIERQYISLERVLMLQEQLYLFLLKQREEAQMSLAKSSPSLLTLDPPYVLKDQPGLTTKMVAAVAVFMGLVLAFAFVYLFKYGKAPYINADEIKDALKMPVLGVLPLTSTQTPVIEKTQDEPFRMLRSDVVFTLSDFDGKTILVTSVVPEAGKAYVAANLATANAMVNLRTLVIDANLRNPQIADYFGATPNYGVSDIVISGIDINSCIVNASVGNNASVDILAAGTRTDRNASDIVGSQTLRNAIESVKEQYNYIIIIAPEFRDYSDAYELTDICDMTLSIMPNCTTVPADVQCVNDVYLNARLKRIACVING